MCLLVCYSNLPLAQCVHEAHYPESLRGIIHPHFHTKPPDFDVPVGCSGLVLVLFLQQTMGRRRSVLFVYCETVENHFPISLDETGTTEHERFSTAATCSRWWMTALWGDGTCHWQMMMHQIGHSSTLAQADTPVFNNLTSDAGADGDFNKLILLFCYGTQTVKPLFWSKLPRISRQTPWKDLDKIREEQNMEPKINETRF